VVWTKKLKPQEHDVIVVRRCNSGDSAVVPANLECAIGQNLVVLRADGKQVLPEFLRWLTRGPDWWGQVNTFINVGAVFDSLKCREIPNFEVCIPPLDDQRAIVKVLGSLDDRAELLRQKNRTLEATAQALFKSWFVDFDPVRARAEGLPPAGIGADTAALFPSEFEDSVLGPIPKGWQARSLDSFAIYLNGLALQKYPPESDDEYLPVIKIAQLRAGHTNGSDRASARLKPEFVVEDGDVLFSWSGSLEVEVWFGGRGALNQHLFKVTSAEVPNWFYYHATRQHLPSFRETAAHKATTMGHIQRRHLTEAKIAVPDSVFMGVLSTVMQPLFDRRRANGLQAKSLAAIRDTLLPRLISGKLRLPEAEATIEEAIA
jgi:type I restriction enzyme S subunit